MKREFRISTGRGYRLWASLQSPSAIRRKPLVILCHGLGVASDHPLMKTLKVLLLKQGNTVLTFDFAGHGKSGGSVKSRMVRHFIADIGDIVAYVRKQGFAEDGITLIGYSIGALASLIYAASNPRSIVGVVSIGCNAEAKQKQKALLAKKKIRTFGNFSIIGSTKVARNFWDDRNRFEPKGFMQKLHMPVLFICGSDDRTNPPRDSKLLYSWTKSSMKQCVLIPSADHYFKPKAHREAVARSIQIWLKKIQ